MLYFRSPMRTLPPSRFSSASHSLFINRILMASARLAPRLHRACGQVSIPKRDVATNQEGFCVMKKSHDRVCVRAFVLAGLTAFALVLALVAANSTSAIASPVPSVTPTPTPTPDPNSCNSIGIPPRVCALESAVSNLQIGVQANQVSLQNQVSGLSSGLTAEAATRAAATQQLQIALNAAQAALAAETLARQMGDGNEAAARQAADALLQTAINTAQSALQATINAEITARIAGDAAEV